MATIQSTLKIFDGMSSPMKGIIVSVNNANNALRALQGTTMNTMDVTHFEQVQKSVIGLNDGFNKMDRNINNAGRQQQKFNEDIKNGTSNAMTLNGVFARIGTMIGISKIVSASDAMAQINARLNLMNEGQQTTVDLQNEIFESAQRSRAAFFSTANAVSKMGILAGKAFRNYDEIIAFTELMNKNFIIGNAGVQEQTASMYQLTQAMASGRLQGDEFRSIMENAPLLATAIEKYMRNAGFEGSMKDWSSEGLLTADVIKAAMFSSADEVERRFKEMPMTWSQVWTVAVNKVIKISQPILGFINVLANNWSILEPIVLGIVIAMGLYFLATKGVALASAAFATVQTFLSIGFGILSGNTAAASAAMFTYNSALLACPITWIIIAIIALIAIFYAAVAAVNKFKGTSISATGLIMGAFYTLGAFLLNTFIVPSYNAFVRIANFFGNVFNDPVAAVRIAFYDLSLDVIGYIQEMASAIEAVINKIPGVNVDITSGLDRFYNQLESAQKKVKDESGWVEYVKKMDYWSYQKAWDKGNKIGIGLEDKVMGIFNQDAIFDSLAQTADNTGKMKDSMEITGEDLKYLRDIAERDVINRFTTAELSVTMQTTANIKSDMDIDGVISQLENKTYEMLLATAEGAY